MKIPALLIGAALLVPATGFASDDMCELKLDQLEEAREAHHVNDTLDDQIEKLKGQAEEHQSNKRVQDCASLVDQAMQLLNSAPIETD